MNIYERLGFSLQKKFSFLNLAWNAVTKWQRKGYHTHVGWVKDSKLTPWGLWTLKKSPDVNVEQLLET